MTGVLLMLISGAIRALAGFAIVVIPADGLIKLRFQNGAVVLPSAQGIDAAVFRRHENNIVFGAGNREIRNV